jgi:hypothetical protein
VDRCAQAAIPASRAGAVTLGSHAERNVKLTLESKAFAIKTLAAVAGAFAATAGALILTGCGNNGDLDLGKVKALVEQEPVQLDSEQVSMSDAQLNCGVEQGLWDAPSDQGPRALARLEQKGRDLQFSDDVAVHEPGFPNPYTQVRGKLPLRVQSIGAVADGPDPDTKLVEAKVGAVISNSCFGTPLWIMGVRKGKFSEENLAVLQFERDGKEWHFVKVVH